MEQVKEAFVRDLRRRVHAKNAEGLIRPTRRVLGAILAIRQVDFPAAHPRDALGESEIGFALTDLFVRLLLLSDVSRDHHPRGSLIERDRGGVKEDENERSVLAQMPPATAETRAVDLTQHLKELPDIECRAP